MKKKVSIIVPVYNVENYLEICLDSLVNQTLKEIEIIIVNDGSPDNSQKIIDKYAKKYPQKIKKFIKENGGLSDARNYGLQHATGDYIAFIDSDDYVDEDMFAKMYNKAIENNYDIVVCNLKYIYEDTNKIELVNSNIKEDIENKEDIKKLLINIYPSACNKIYKKEIFANNFRFKKGILFEDVEFTCRLIPKINKLGVVKDYFLNYTQRTGTISKKANVKIFDYISNMNGIIDYYKKNNYYDEYFEELEYCYVRYLYATFIKQAALLEKKDFIKAVNEAINNVKKNFPNYRKNKYFLSNGLKGIYLLSFNKYIAKLVFTFNHKKN